MGHGLALRSLEGPQVNSCFHLMEKDLCDWAAGMVMGMSDDIELLIRLAGTGARIQYYNPA
jgi:hypothetical protein